jgi:hypothetical protein
MTSFNSWAYHTNASLKRLGRNLERSAREAEKQEKLRLRAQLKATAESAIETYQEVMTTLTMAHKEQIEPIDWTEILHEPAPAEPARVHAEEQSASTRLNTYRPSILDKLFGGTARKRLYLQNAVAIARKKDEQRYTKARAEWQTHYNEWESSQQLARQILQNDTAAYN